jgi:hypothetical protein
MLPREQWDALEADLMQVGFTLDDYPQRLSLYSLFQFVRHATRGTNLFRVVNTPERADWGYPEELLARLIEATQEGNWQRAGRAHAPRPRPLQRPWEVAPKTVQKFGRKETAVTIEEFHKLWDGKAA